LVEFCYSVQGYIEIVLVFCTLQGFILNVAACYRCYGVEGILLNLACPLEPAGKYTVSSVLLQSALGHNKFSGRLQHEGDILNETVCFSVQREILNVANITTCRGLY